MDATDAGERLYKAIRSENGDEVRGIVRDNPAILSSGYRGVLNWITIAFRAKQITMVELLVELGGDINKPSNGSTFETPLWAALGKDAPFVVESLLKLGADPNVGGQVISAVAGAKTNSRRMVELLDKYGADLHHIEVHASTGKRMNALSHAIAWGKDDVVEYLKSRGVRLPESQADEAGLQDKAALNEVVDHFSRTFGEVHPLSLTEVVPTASPPITIHAIPKAVNRNCLTLFTTGMSDESMTVPKGQEDYQYAELFIQLPEGWKYKDLGNPKNSWPLDWLRTAAQNPHLNRSWLGGPMAIISNDDPPRPLGPGVKFTALLLLAMDSFKSRDGRTIQLYRATPIFPEETEFEKREGMAALLQAFDNNGVGFVLDVKRKNVGL